jgi:hypothetical protein
MNTPFTTRRKSSNLNFNISPSKKTLSTHTHTPLSTHTPTTPTTPKSPNLAAVASAILPETTEVLPSLAANPEKCDWWASFAIKITNLINLLETENYKLSFNYVITGSSAVALFAYFTNIDELMTLKEPNDGDIIIIPIKKHKSVSFRSINLFKIGNYVIRTLQEDEKSATFLKPADAQSDTTFKSIDVNIEDNIEYITLDDNIKILSPIILLKRYKENFREKNNSKRRFLSSRNSNKKTVFIFKSVNTRNNKRQSKKPRLSNFGNERTNGHTNVNETRTRTVLQF